MNTSHKWEGKMIHRELCKKLKCGHTIKWYINKLESIQENETHKILLDFEIQTYDWISSRSPDLVIHKQNRTCHRMDFAGRMNEKVKTKKAKR